MLNIFQLMSSVRGKCRLGACDKRVITLSGPMSYPDKIAKGKCMCANQLQIIIKQLLTNAVHC